MSNQYHLPGSHIRPPGTFFTLKLFIMESDKVIYLHKHIKTLFCTIITPTDRDYKVSQWDTTYKKGKPKIQYYDAYYFGRNGVWQISLPTDSSSSIDHPTKTSEL